MNAPKTLLFVTLTSALSLAGCGGGSGMSPMPAPLPSPPIVTALMSVSAADGMVSSDGGVAVDFGIAVGDSDAGTNGRTLRGYVTFDLSSIPSNAQIQSAVIRMSQASVFGAPYAPHRGPIVVDHLDFGPTLDGGDFGTSAIALDIGVLFDSAAPGYRSLDITTRVQADIASGFTRSQFRLRFRDVESELNGADDYVRLEDSENTYGTGNVPLMEVVYTMP